MASGLVLSLLIGKSGTDFGLAEPPISAGTLKVRKPNSVDTTSRNTPWMPCATAKEHPARLEFNYI